MARPSREYEIVSDSHREQPPRRSELLSRPGVSARRCSRPIDSPERPRRFLIVRELARIDKASNRGPLLNERFSLWAFVPGGLVTGDFVNVS